MKMEKIIVVVDTGPSRENVSIHFDRVAGEITYFQSGAAKEVLGFTLPIAEAVLNLVHDGEVKAG